MASNTPDMTSFLNPFLCANTERKINEKIVPCQNEAKFTCTKCKLVQYCCKECQLADRKLHKADCNSKYLRQPYSPRWEIEKPVPEFMKGPSLAPFGSLQYLWGNVPALNLLRVDDNEGEESIKKQNLALLFAASGDLRNVVKSVVGLPENYAGNCTVVVNDFNTNIVARNAMLLLTALHFEPEVAAPIMLHLWYSAMLPQAIVQALQVGIQPYIDDVCNKIKDRPVDSTQAKTFNIGGSSIRLTLEKWQWIRLAKMFEVREDLSAPEAQLIRRSVTMSRIDHIDRSIYKMSPGRRVGVMRYRQDGVVLPFGSSRKDFVVPNPTLFNERKWPMKDDADPLDDWSHDDYIKYVPTAKNDVYGAFFFYLRDILLAFCKRIRSFNIAFQLLAINAVHLPTYDKNTKFDRIEVSNVCDRGYVDPSATLATFSSMLKTRSENPKAALLMLFLNAVREEENDNPISLDRTAMAQYNQQIRKCFGIKQPVIDAAMGKGGWGAFQHMTSPNFTLVTDFLNLCGDFDVYFKRFLNSADPHSGASMYDLARRHGMRMRSQHSIIAPWPYRITRETTEAKFKTLVSESTSGHERYLELERAY